MRVYPIGLDLRGRKCLVVGGGKVAERKVAALLEAGAGVWVVSPSLSAELALRQEQGDLHWNPREYAAGDLEGAFLAIAATSFDEVNARVFAEARQARVLVNVADDPEKCDFILPAMVRRGDLAIAVFTGGQSPALARKIREDLEATYGPEYGQFLEHLGEQRRRILAEVPDPERRRQIFEDLISRWRSHMSRIVKVGSRESALALEQTHWVIGQLSRLVPGCQFAVTKMVTKGDVILDVTLAKIGGKGLFVKEIEKALLDGKVDLAVHSLKDMPGELPPGLALGAITRREDPRDVLVSREGRKLDDLPSGAKVGTSSLRRGAQVKRYRPDLEIVPIRGNIGTRLRKLDQGDFDAIVMALAGLRRLGWADRITEIIPIEISLPAVGQGALGLEIREGDRETLDLVAVLNDRETSLATRAERAFLGRLEGSCQVPIGALGSLRGDKLHLDGMVADPDGSDLLRSSLEGAPDDPVAVGRALAERLLEMGAGEILERCRKAAE